MKRKVAHQGESWCRFVRAQGPKLVVAAAAGIIGQVGHALLLVPMLKQGDPGSQACRQPTEPLGLLRLDAIEPRPIAQKQA